MHLNYKSFGEGTPVVILHGLLGSLDNWQTFARKLGSDFKVFTVDLRNHGKSPHSSIHTYSAMAGDLLEFFDEQGINKAHVIGHSMGGKVAMEFAIHHPERLLKLIVVDISPRSYEGTHDEILDALSNLDISIITSRAEADSMLERSIPDFSVRQFLLKNLDRQGDGTFQWKMNLKALEDNYQNINVPVTSGQQLNVPTLVIRGGKSGYVNENDMASFRQLFTTVDLITIPQSGHWVHAEAPDEFYQAVRSFL